MSKLPVVTARRLVRAFLKAGFYVHHQTGSHINLRHKENHHLHIVIPMHSRDLAPKTLKSILVQAKISIEELTDLL